MSKKINTSWGKDAKWYEKVIDNDDSFQKQVIAPNLLRMLDVKKGEQILDLGCGTGFFSQKIAALGAKVMGVDIGAELIKIAQKNSSEGIKYVVSSADNLKFIQNSVLDKVVIVLALQNILNASGVVEECARILKSGGKLLLVLNHPAFRIPQQSSWGWDPEPQGFKPGSENNTNVGSGVQYRRIDRYLSESKNKIQMHPGDDPTDITWSFHRPLQFYFKLFNKNNLAVSRLEEWVSHRETPTGPRKEAENRARAEFPMFLCLEVVKL